MLGVAVFVKVGGGLGVFVGVHVGVGVEGGQLRATIGKKLARVG